MKKVILVAATLVAGISSASVFVPKNEIVKKEIVSENKDCSISEVKEAKRYMCLSVAVTCTSAYTCQDWSAEQWLNWADQIQNNYCMINSPFTP